MLRDAERARASGAELREQAARARPSTATLIRESLYGLERNFSGNVNAGFVDACVTRSVSQSWHGVRMRRARARLPARRADGPARTDPTRCVRRAQGEPYRPDALRSSNGSHNHRRKDEARRHQKRTHMACGPPPRARGRPSQVVAYVDKALALRDARAGMAQVFPLQWGPRSEQQRKPVGPNQPKAA
jgi:hypothetical protein